MLKNYLNSKKQKSLLLYLGFKKIFIPENNVSKTVLLRIWFQHSLQNQIRKNRIEDISFFPTHLQVDS
jgi:hypothetical protein